MSLKITSILLIIIAGLLNGSFVIPTKYLKNSPAERIWFWHSIVGVGIIPWVILVFEQPDAFLNYKYLPFGVLFFIVASGIVFGLGQIWFAKAIELIGIALSFTINLGIGLIIGSMFVIFYQSAFLTKKGFLVILSVLFILCGLIVSYYASKIKKTHDDADCQHKFNYKKGWALASLTGVTSGLQNITFVFIAFSVKTQFHVENSFWVWPPFLLASVIPMVLGFSCNMSKFPVDFLTSRNLFLIIIMGLFFTGSLALYSAGMNQLSDQQKIVGWPAFMVSIILASQIWSLLYKEARTIALKNKFLRFFSLIMLVAAIIILAFQG